MPKQKILSHLCLILLSAENSSLTSQEKSKENLQKREAINAVINYFLDQMQQQNKKKDDQKSGSK